VTSQTLLIAGNLVLDRPAAQRMILHSIPKDAISRNPSKANEDPLPSYNPEVKKKRSAGTITDAETGSEPPQKKKSKGKKCTPLNYQGLKQKRPRMRLKREKRASLIARQTRNELACRRPVISELHY
jgi:hypothetical protein